MAGRGKSNIPREDTAGDSTPQRKIKYLPAEISGIKPHLLYPQHGILKCNDEGVNRFTENSFQIKVVPNLNCHANLIVGTFCVVVCHTFVYHRE